MEKLLIEFVNTFDLTLKKFQAQVEDSPGVSKLTISQFQYINAIHELGEPTITEIAGKLNITKASVTTSINKLSSMGYVTKTQSSADRRVFHVSLTESSNRLIKAKYLALKEYDELIGAALSQEEAQQFEKSLAKIVEIFKRV